MENIGEGGVEAPTFSGELERRAPSSDRHGGFAGGLASFALAGLTTMEVLSLAVVYLGVMAFLWMSGWVAPERLVSDAGFRSAWVIVVLALLRPLTWLPYALPFLAFRSFTHAMLEERRPILRNAAAHVLTIGFVAAALWLLALVVQGAVTATLSGLAFLTGSGSPSTLGTFRGDWNAARVIGVVVIALTVRIVAPPLGPDLDLSPEPVLWFGSGTRGRFDRFGVAAAVAASTALVVVGLFLARAR